MKERGAGITAISVGPHGHDASAFYAIPEALRWFSELVAEAARARALLREHAWLLDAGKSAALDAVSQRAREALV